jgi:hypothetical protein
VFELDGAIRAVVEPLGKSLAMLALVVVDGEKLGPEHLEVIGATRAVKEGGAFYRSYLDPKVGGLARTHSAAQDFDKLEQLCPPLADYAAFLLVGFDAAPRPMDPEVYGLVARNRLRDRGWNLVGPSIWQDNNCTSCRRVIWFFWRKSTSPTDGSPEHDRG